LNAAQAMRDLVALVADKNMEAALRALLRRHRALGTCPIQADMYVQPDRDPGCRLRSHDFLRPQISSFRHALVFLDRLGCGSDDDANVLEIQIERRLNSSGWRDRARAVVIDPELEAWGWSDSPHVYEVLGWSGRLPDLRVWLSQAGYATAGVKPTDPKAAMEAALQEVGKPRSSAIYAQLADRVGFERCRDPAFARLREIIQQWFGTNPSSGAVPIG
jgi:hypothetical protein